MRDPLVDRLVSAVIGSEAAFARSAVHDASNPTYRRRIDAEERLSAVLAASREVVRIATITEPALSVAESNLRDALAAADAAIAPEKP